MESHVVKGNPVRKKRGLRKVNLSLEESVTLNVVNN